MDFKNRKHLLIGAGVVVVAGVGIWLVAKHVNATKKGTLPPISGCPDVDQKPVTSTKADSTGNADVAPIAGVGELSGFLKEESVEIGNIRMKFSADDEKGLLVVDAPIAEDITSVENGIQSQVDTLYISLPGFEDTIGMEYGIQETKLSFTPTAESSKMCIKISELVSSDQKFSLKIERSNGGMLPAGTKLPTLNLHLFKRETPLVRGRPEWDQEGFI